jgi:hypothetical protein
MYPVPIGSGLGEIRGLTFFCAGSDANMAEVSRLISWTKTVLSAEQLDLCAPTMRPRWNMPKRGFVVALELRRRNVLVSLRRRLMALR